MVGEEISSADGEILALFIQEEIKPTLGAPETIDLIHEQGALLWLLIPLAHSAIPSERRYTI